MIATIQHLLRPSWIALILLSVIAAAGAALWVGLQQESQQTATTFVFGRRVGSLDRPIPTLDDHLDDIVNAVEFPTVFEAIEERTLLRADKDYEFTIARVDDTQSVIEIVVQADRPGDAERVARILAEEVVDFVLAGQDLSVATEIRSIESRIESLESEQDRLRSLAFGVNPIVARDRIELELINVSDAGPASAVEGDLRAQLTNLQPLAESYRRNAFELRRLYTDRARGTVERSDVVASIAGINSEWYRSITPVEAASNVPVAIAMAFAAAVPAALVAIALAALNLNLRLTGSLIPHRRRHPA
ncbi:MAG: hypothetical protein ACR2P0_07260 [Acidimicrobiales bacterium]